MLMQTPQHLGAGGGVDARRHAEQQADISARLERLPITRRVFWTRNIIGAATFFDGYM